MNGREKYYWIKTKQYGWEIAIMIHDGESIYFNVMNDGGTELPSNVIQAIKIPYPDEETEGENVIK